MKQYRAIFFDWDGTAVVSRKAPVDDVILPMRQLLSNGVKLAVISGTTIENIAGGKLHQYFTPEQLRNLYLGLGRGAYNYAYNESGKPYVFADQIPAAGELLKIHRVAFDIHEILLRDYHFPTDIIFSRPNYCKIDLMVTNDRGDQLFFQTSERERLLEELRRHQMGMGITGLISLATECGLKYGIPISATTDAKYLEVGISSKSDNVNRIIGKMQAEDPMVQAEQCAFLGDEFVGIADGVFGSDSCMITDVTRAADFFDVSAAEGRRPENVIVLGGGVQRFRQFLEAQIR